MITNTKSLVGIDVSGLGKNTRLPNEKRNHFEFDFERVERIVNKRESALPEISKFLSKAKNEKEICEGLYVLDRMLEKGVKGVDKLYPVISKFNDTDNPNIQVYLAGIYRKTQVPDAFGPLIKMMLKQTFFPTGKYFDPTEEIGGAILEYIRNTGAKELYEKTNRKETRTNPLNVV